MSKVKLEICSNTEWLMSNALRDDELMEDFDEAYSDELAANFVDCLDAILCDTFNENVAVARGERGTFHGWNGARFKRVYGYGCVGTFSEAELSRKQQDIINNAVLLAQQRMIEKWCAPAALQKVARFFEGVAEVHDRDFKNE